MADEDKNTKNNILHAVLAFVIFLLISPLITVVFVIMNVKKTIASQKLKAKYKGEYIEIMKNLDTIWAMDDGEKKNSVETIHYIEMSQEKNHIDLYNHFKESIKEIYESNEDPFNKIFSTKGFDLDYYFWKKLPTINIDDYVSIYKYKTNQEYINYKDAKEFVNDVANKPFPLNNTAVLSIHVSDKPIIDEKSKENGKKVYVVFCRLHHCLGDGVTLDKLMKKIMTEIPRSGTSAELKLQKLHERYNINAWKVFAYMLKSFFYMPLTLYKMKIYPNDVNILHGLKLSGKVNKGWKMNSGEESLLVKIERIRKRIPNTSYNEVILTALSESYLAYFVKNENKMPVPSHMSLGVTMRVLKINLKQDNSKKFENDFSIATLKLPITRDFENGFYKRLFKVKESIRNFKESTELMALIWLGVFISPFPVSYLRKMYRKSSTTLSYTNFPGSSKTDLRGGFTVKDTIFTIPLRRDTGVGMAFLTYNDTLEIGLTIDSALLTQRDDVEFIMDRFVSSIKNMDEITYKEYCKSEMVTKFQSE